MLPNGEKYSINTIVNNAVGLGMMIVKADFILHWVNQKQVGLSRS